MTGIIVADAGMCRVTVGGAPASKQAAEAAAKAEAEDAERVEKAAQEEADLQAREKQAAADATDAVEKKKSRRKKKKNSSVNAGSIFGDDDPSDAMFGKY